MMHFVRRQVGSMSRDIYKGPLEDICNALVSHCPRADFVPDALVLELRSMRQRRLIRMTPIVRGLSEIQWNLSFSKTSMETPSDACASARIGPCRYRRKRGRSLFQQKRHTKLRNNLRTIQQARLRTPNARWFMFLFSRMGRSSQPCS
jgi:hypothetical protein